MSESWNDIGWTLFKDRQAMKSCAFGPGPGVMLHHEHGGQRRYRVKEQGVTSASSTSPKERGLKRQVEMQHSYRNAGKYEFLIDGVWVDESSHLNVLEDRKSIIAVFYSPK